MAWPEHRLPSLSAGDARLRWLDEQDVDALFDVFSDPEVTRYWSSPAWTERSAAHAYVAKIHEFFASGELFQWGIARVDDDHVIGTCTLAHIDRVHRRAELGYALGRAHWRKGYASAAIGRVIRYAFEDLDLHRLEADVDPRNAASIASLERLGFRREGLMRERWHVNGEICDGYFYGLLRSEWSG